MSRSASAKISLSIIAVVTAIGLCSFTVTKKSTEVKNAAGVSGDNRWEQYNKVQNFVYDNICTPIRQADGNGGIKVKSFSRCPSGYQPTFADAVDSVKTSRFVTGRVTLYKGCAGEYVCDFKVCADQNFAVVKSKNMSDYVSVSEWLEMRSKKTAPAVKENSGEIKG